MMKGPNYSIDIEAIEAEIKKMVHQGQEVVIIGGTHALHRHEKLAIAVSKAMRSHSLQETKKDGRFSYKDISGCYHFLFNLLIYGIYGVWVKALALSFYVSELERRHAIPSLAQRHILAGLASVVGGLSATYEKASHVHERPVVNWLLAAGCHPFGPFSNTSQISQLLRDVALRNTIYARVDSALHRIRETSEAFAAEHLKTPLGEPVKGRKNKSSTELWLEKFYKKKTNLPEPFPHEYVDHVLTSEREKMKCCSIEYIFPTTQNYIYAGILLAGFFVYFVVIFFASPVR
ncbi:UNVERIFIED_CONTAM: hypothetical protein Sradi_3782100 [Sesamum radiatum]|uniref:Uncharacterized protein n=1 Tax=Sesamum radiatum TaxID=300843 RepID=A0AAW2Q041_SESRA